MNARDAVCSFETHPAVLSNRFAADSLASMRQPPAHAMETYLTYRPILPCVQVSPPMFAAGPPESVKGKFAMGGRVNAYVNSGHTYAPNLDIELYHWPGFGSLFMYLNLVPRRSLVRLLESRPQARQSCPPVILALL